MKQHLRDSNYQHNQSLSVPQTPSGLLTCQPQLTQWRMGRYTADYNGCGWIALYNVLFLLNRPVPPAEIIRWLDGQGIFRGTVLQGTFGLYPWAPRDYLKAQGLTPKQAVRLSAQEQLAAICPAGVVFYLTIQRGHFVAWEQTARFTPEGKPLLRFYNDIHGDHADIRTLAQFRQDNHAIFSLMTGVLPPL